MNWNSGTGFARPALRLLAIASLMVLFLLLTTATVAAQSGACLLANGTCADYPENFCTMLGGTYQGDGTSCSDPELAGACCGWDGTCQIVALGKCVLNPPGGGEYVGGYFHGSGTVCESVDCSFGACCDGSGSCSDVLETDCTTSGGTYQGDYVPCAADPCPDPMGACCLPDGTCEQKSQADCWAAYGEYKGDDVPCEATTCSASVFGACCLHRGGCEQSHVIACAVAPGGADYMGDGTDCDDVTCEYGACCFPDGSCEVLSQATCIAQDGTYQGDGVLCEEGLCPFPEGACCLPDDTCDVMTFGECNAAGGTYKGDDSECYEGICEVVLTSGACCLPDGSCDQLTLGDCAARGGDYHGDATRCYRPEDGQGVVCPEATEGACCLPSGVCVQADATTCEASLGYFRGVGTDCAGEACSDVGACCVIGSPNGCRAETESSCALKFGKWYGTGTTCDTATYAACAQTAACCLPDGSCELLSATECVQRSGTPQAGMNCATATCASISLEACCYADGTCADLPSALCTADGGAPRGAGTACSTLNPGCEVTVGACCLPDGSCTDSLTEAACEALAGVYQGNETTCDSTECPDQAKGACCLPDGTCHQMTEAECTLAGGTNTWAEGVSCGDVECTSVTGACCLDDGTCLNTGEANCAALRGTYKGDDTTCSEQTCAGIAIGACCYDTGICSHGTITACVDSGGEYQGDGTDCDTAGCPQPVWGACCLPDGDCTELPEDVCGAAGGTYRGDDTECYQVECPGPSTGACCQDDGSCSELSYTECRSDGGTYYGDDTTCNETNCAEPPTGACCLGPDDCQTLTGEECALLYGDYRGQGTSCDTETCVALATGACLLGSGTGSDPLRCEQMTGPDCLSAGGSFSGEDTACNVALSLPISITVVADPAGVLAPNGTGNYSGQTTVAVTVCNVGSSVQDVLTLTHNILGDLNGRGTCVMSQTLNVGECYDCSFPAPVAGGPDTLLPQIVGASVTDSEGVTSQAIGRDDVFIYGLALSKEDRQDPWYPGGTLIYDLVVRNSNSVTLTGVIVTDTLDSAWATISSPVSGSEYVWNVGTLAPDERKTTPVQVYVDPSTPADTTITNTLTAVAAEFDGVVETDETTLIAMTDLVIVKTADHDPWYAGGTLSYTVQVRNTGDYTLTNVLVTDTVDASWCTITDDAASRDDYHVWSIASLASGESRTFYLETLVSSETPDGTRVENRVSAIADELVDLVSIQQWTRIYQPSLSISKEAQTERAIAGATLAYTLTVENSGHITLTDVVVTDTVDPDWTVIDPEGGLSKEWQVGELAPGATKVLLLQVLVDPDTPEGTIVENQVIASSRETGASASDTRQTSICVARLEMSKHAVADPWYAGWFLGYDIYITNTGCVDLTGLVVTDTVDEEWALIYDDPLPDDRKVKVWDLGDLAIDESVHLELEVTTWTHIPDDTTITNTIAGWANELTSTVTVSETTQILAPPAQTPEPTATPTATPTLEPTLPPRVDLALPLILR